ncbi:Cytochrome b-245 beta chain [Balamuthia mandrillaris]
MGNVLHCIKSIPKVRFLTCKDVQTYWINEGPKALFILLYVLANIAVILERFIHYYVVDDEVFKVLSWGLIGARCSAAALKLNCAIILIPVLRNFLSWIRGTWIGTYLPVDKAIVFHKNIAWFIAFLSAVHITSHYMNFNTLEHWDIEDPESRGDLTAWYSDLEPDGEMPTTWDFAWTTIAGITGHIVVFCMILMYSSAVESVRRPNFEAFWFTHHLFIIFYGLLCAHGAGEILEPPTFWAWVLGPAVAYLVERMVRILRGHQSTVLLMAIQHPSKVIELQMKKSKFRYKPGQYLFLNCPYIAPHEWHPFTISSAPEEDFVSVHIRVVGDWTGKLAKLLNPEKQLGVVCENMLTAVNGDPILRIDGPFGAASEDIFKFQTVMLFAAGIGVTPFASILKTIRYRIEAQLETGSVDMPITKVYFYWVTRDKNAFEWFFELLSALEAENINNFLEIHAYLTSVRNTKAAKELIAEEEEEDDGRDPFTGLMAGTHYGRPDLNAIFEDKTQNHPNDRIGVFFCGPRVMSKMLYKSCRKYTKKSSTKFYYHKENF